ncbi:MAG TPA: C/D box methylation guide ribonucleoprotein complex aNOP56 subunit [Candidatus Methanomethylia archaeon]|nr:C/D box methylation guide ribonucleoprotein complex aNOP56 subunit [Candidatus Methanomethylicia archaeon]
MKKAYLVDTIAGVVALDPEFSVIGVEPYPRDPAQAAERALKLERGDLPEEVEKLCRELRDKVEIFVVEHEEEARKLREKLGVEVDVEKPSEGGLYARSHLEKVAAALGFASLDDYLKFAYEASLTMARAKIREAAEKRDKFVAQAIEALDELDRTINILVSRVREWYGLHFPEMDDLVPSHREYVAIVKQFGLRQKITIDGLKALGFEEKRAKEIVSAAERSMGANVSEFDIEAIAKLASLVSEMYNLRKEFEAYIDTAMEEIAPNIRALVGPTLGARLIALAGGLENLAKKPASTIQVLGAEKALFRALRTGGKPPKHGVIFQYPEIHRSPRWQRGKIARALAAKLSIAARVDAFTGDYVADKLKEDLRKRIDEIKKKYAKPPVRRPPKKIKKKEKKKKRRR